MTNTISADDRVTGELYLFQSSFRPQPPDRHSTIRSAPKLPALLPHQRMGNQLHNRLHHPITDDEPTSKVALLPNASSSSQDQNVLFIRLSTTAYRLSDNMVRDCRNLNYFSVFHFYKLNQDMKKITRLEHRIKGTPFSEQSNSKERKII